MPPGSCPGSRGPPPSEPRRAVGPGSDQEPEHPPARCALGTLSARRARRPGRAGASRGHRRGAFTGALEDRAIASTPFRPKTARLAHGRPHGLHARLEPDRGRAAHALLRVGLRRGRHLRGRRTTPGSRPPHRARARVQAARGVARGAQPCARRRCPPAVTTALQPGGTSVVPEYSSTSAGPSKRTPGTRRRARARASAPACRAEHGGPHAGHRPAGSLRARGGRAAASAKGTSARLRRHTSSIGRASSR
jgi:hypothetical protein